MSEKEGKNSAKKLGLNDKEKFFVDKAIVFYQEKFGKLTAKDKTDMFTLKTLIEYFHDKSPMSPALHSLKKAVFSKLDEFAGEKVKTFNELFAEEKRDKELIEAEKNRARVKSLKELVNERESKLRRPILEPGKIALSVSKLDLEPELEPEKEEIVEKKERKPGINPDDKLIYTLDDLYPDLEYDFDDDLGDDL